MYKKGAVFSFLIGCILCSALSYSAIYKWTDEHGQVHFSDTPQEGMKIKRSFKPKKPSYDSSMTPHQSLLNSGESMRKKILGDLLAKSGKNCRATTTFLQGNDSKENAYWNVKCEGGASYVIKIKNDARGSSRIMSCEVLRAMNMKCFEKFSY